MKKHANTTIRREFMAILCGVLVVHSAASAGADTVVRAGSGRFMARNATDGDSDTWRASTPTAGDTITWSSGINFTDRKPWARQTWVEAKFAFPGATARALTGFQDTDGPGVLGSWTGALGTGRARVVPRTIWGTNRTVVWDVTAGGTLGAGNFRGYFATARGNDPYLVTPGQLNEVGIVESEYDLFIVAGLQAGTEVGPAGEMRLEVFYDDASGTTNLLNLFADPNGVEVTTEPPAGLRFYLLDTLDEGPTERVENLITLDELKSLLESDLLSDGVLDTPLYVGIVWEDIPVPTVEIEDGVLARFRVESVADDAGAGDDRCVTTVAPWSEGFADYIPGNGLIGNCGWKGINNDPNFDAIVAPEPFFETPNSVDVQGPTNVLREFDVSQGGIWLFQTWQFIPGDFVSFGNDPQAGSHFMLFNTYHDNGPVDVSADIQIDSNDGQIKFYCGDINNPTAVPYIVDQWVPIEVVVDLDNDMTIVFYDQQPVCEYSWTGGAFGQGNGQPAIAAVTLFARESGSVFYDEMVLDSALPDCNAADMNCDNEINSFDIEPFLDLLFNGTAPCADCTGDLDGNGSIDAFDIEPFLNALFGG